MKTITQLEFDLLLKQNPKNSDFVYLIEHTNFKNKSVSELLKRNPTFEELMVVLNNENYFKIDAVKELLKLDLTNKDLILIFDKMYDEFKLQYVDNDRKLNNILFDIWYKFLEQNPSNDDLYKFSNYSVFNSFAIMEILKRNLNENEDCIAINIIDTYLIKLLKKLKCYLSDTEFVNILKTKKINEDIITRIFNEFKTKCTIEDLMNLINYTDFNQNVLDEILKHELDNDSLLGLLERTHNKQYEIRYNIAIKLIMQKPSKEQLYFLIRNDICKFEASNLYLKYNETKEDLNYLLFNNLCVDDVCEKLLNLELDNEELVNIIGKCDSHRNKAAKILLNQNPNNYELEHIIIKEADLKQEAAKMLIENKCSNNATLKCLIQYNLFVEESALLILNNKPENIDLRFLIINNLLKEEAAKMLFLNNDLSNNDLLFIIIYTTELKNQAAVELLKRNIDNDFEILCYIIMFTDLKMYAWNFLKKCKFIDTNSTLKYETLSMMLDEKLPIDDVIIIMNNIHNEKSTFDKFMKMNPTNDELIQVIEKTNFVEYAWNKLLEQNPNVEDFICILDYIKSVEDIIRKKNQTNDITNKHIIIKEIELKKNVLEQLLKLKHANKYLKYIIMNFGFEDIIVPIILEQNPSYDDSIFIMENTSFKKDESEILNTYNIMENIKNK